MNHFYNTSRYCECSHLCTQKQTKKKKAAPKYRYKFSKLTTKRKIEQEKQTLGYIQQY